MSSKLCLSCLDNGIERAAVRLMPDTPRAPVDSYSPECEFHAKHWWDGADWDGRALERPINLEPQT